MNTFEGKETQHGHERPWHIPFHDRHGLPSAKSASHDRNRGTDYYSDTLSYNGYTNRRPGRWNGDRLVTSNKSSESVTAVSILTLNISPMLSTVTST